MAVAAGRTYRAGGVTNPALRSMLTYFFPIPQAGTMVANIASISSPMFSDLSQLVYLVGGILLGIFVVNFVIGMLDRLAHRNDGKIV